MVFPKIETWDWRIAAMVLLQEYLPYYSEEVDMPQGTTFVKHFSVQDGAQPQPIKTLIAQKPGLKLADLDRFVGSRFLFHPILGIKNKTFEISTILCWEGFESRVAAHLSGSLKR